jgi:hypothetical protein
VKSIPKYLWSEIETAQLQVMQAEMLLWLPKQPQIRREILQVSKASQVYNLHPDPSAIGGINLNLCQKHFHASLSGPERADLEVECIVHEGSTMTLPIWAVAQGQEAEVNVWDSFGKLVVPDLLTRGIDAPDLLLNAGKYMIIASVTGTTTMVLGAGVAMNEVTLPQAQSVRRHLRAMG